MDPYGELVERLRGLVRLVRRVKQEGAGRHPVLPAGLITTLALIDRSTGCHAKELAAHAGLDPSTVSRAVGTLVARGLVERRADPADGRAGVLVVTAAGHAVLAQARGWYGDLLSRALAHWDPAEVDALTAALGRLTADVGATLEASR